MSQTGTPTSRTLGEGGGFGFAKIPERVFRNESSQLRPYGSCLDTGSLLVYSSKEFPSAYPSGSLCNHRPSVAWYIRWRTWYRPVSASKR